ncbi:ecotropic viral integration site 5 protein [Mytilus galloprovincialis]|uniref:Ecotropic viral integration site 5 protein n=1 Tax=Mytilus galloprovincialis TaxID=29158 RepID=A0A8B6C590_MYTGA|nr:ecotropic viral integration site 5 protein [Mytilus galloprovincialis]
MSSDDKQKTEEVSSLQAEELELLAKLEEANRRLLSDEKSAFNSTPSPTLGHSRQGSASSVVSSVSSNSQQHSEEDGTGQPFGNLWDIWGKLVNDWDNAKKKPAYLKELVRKGIPHPFRGLAWQLLLNVHSSPHKQMYVEYMRESSPSERYIRRDIARTFPDHEFFKEKDGVGQESLFNVMKAYSLHDREVGYCQGSGFIVGLLLMQMPEEEAFAVLVKLMQDYRLRELFKPSMAELSLCMYKLECLIQDLLPALYLHFQSQGFYTSMYASSWFLTLFATTLSLSLACRVMDLFISEGMDIIFKLGIAILQSSQDYLMSLDMEGILKFFTKELPLKYEQEPERLFQPAYYVKYNAKKMKKIEKEYTALKSKENEDQIELRRLRTENRLLRQRIDNLEKESASLADRLIQYQLTRAQEAEETYALKNVLSTIKKELAESQKKLSVANSLIGDIKQRTSSINSASALDDDEAQTVIQNLQEELIVIRLKDADTDSLVKELRSKIKELEDTNVQLQRAPSNDIQNLQEELIAVKLREAEANLGLKEMRQTVHELESMWESFKHKSTADSPTSSPKDKNHNKEVKQLQEDVMTIKVREANCMSDLKDTKQKYMELETQNHICTNQIRRMDEENKLLKAKYEEGLEREKKLDGHIKEHIRKIDDMQSQRREETMMLKIKEAENTHVIAELKQRIAELEIQKEEIWTADQLENKSGHQDLENRIFDLQDEVLQLKFFQNSPKSTSYNGLEVSDSESEEDFEELENPESLNKTLSDIIEGKNKACDLSLNTHHLGAESELTNGQSLTSGFKECLTRETSLQNSSSPIVLVTQDSEVCSNEEETQCNGNLSEDHSDLSANSFSVNKQDVCREIESTLENPSTNGTKDSTNVESSLLDEISSSLQTISFQNQETDENTN